MTSRPGEVLRTPTFYLMWVAYALGCAAGLMVISQLVPFAKSVGIPSTTLAAYGLGGGSGGQCIRPHSIRLDVGSLGPHQRVAADDRHLHGGHADSVFCGRQRGRPVRDAVHSLLVLWHAAFGEWRNGRRFLGHQERWASTTECCSPPGVWLACSVAASAACSTTSIRITKWRSTRRRSGGSGAGVRIVSQAAGVPKAALAGRKSAAVAGVAVRADLIFGPRRLWASLRECRLSESSGTPKRLLKTGFQGRAYSREAR